MWRIAKAPAAGGIPITTLASGVESGLAPIAADDSNLYILDELLIKKIPLDGGKVEKLAAAHDLIGDFGARSMDIATDGINVYWAVKPHPISLPVVKKVSVSGGAVVTLAGGGTDTQSQECRWRVLVESANVYWSSAAHSVSGGCDINKVSTGGGPETAVIDDSLFPDFVVDGNHVYFTDVSTPETMIKKISVDGGPISTVTTTRQLPWVLTADDVNLYWIDPRQPDEIIGGVGKVAKGGGDDALLVPGPLETNRRLVLEGLAIDGSSVYWTEAVGGTIKKVTPK